MASDTVAVVLSVVFCILPTCLMQAIGTFTDHWVSNSTCENIGLHTACCQASITEHCVDFDLHPTVAGMHLFAAVVMLSAVIGTCCSYLCEGEDYVVFTFAGFCGTLLYPVAGLVSFIGCMMLVPEYSGHGYTFGYSYGLCITSGLMVILICISLISSSCYSSKKIETNHDTGVIYYFEVISITTMVKSIYHRNDED